MRSLDKCITQVSAALLMRPEHWDIDESDCDAVKLTDRAGCFTVTLLWREDGWCVSTWSADKMTRLVADQDAAYAAHPVNA